MIASTTVFRKTELGNAEIATRKLGLRAELRRLLIMVDGRNNVTRLAAVARPGEAEALLYELLAAGVIEAGDGSSTPAAQVSGSSDTSPAPTPEQFKAARQAGVRHLNDTLGPAAESFALRLERAKDAQELRDAVTQVRASLERMNGAAEAQRFLDAVRAAAAKF